MCRRPKVSVRISSGRSRARGCVARSRRASRRVRPNFARARRRSARTGRGDPLRDLSDFQPAPPRARRHAFVAADELHARVDARERDNDARRASDAMLRTSLEAHLDLPDARRGPLARRALRATARIPRRSPDADEERHRRRARFPKAAGEIFQVVGGRRSVSTTTGPRSPSSPIRRTDRARPRRGTNFRIAHDATSHTRESFADATSRAERAPPQILHPSTARGAHDAAWRARGDPSWSSTPRASA